MATAESPPPRSSISHPHQPQNPHASQHHPANRAFQSAHRSFRAKHRTHPQQAIFAPQASTLPTPQATNQDPYSRVSSQRKANISALGLSGAVQYRLALCAKCACGTPRIESVTVKFDDDSSKEFLAKLDTGNSTKASCLEVGELTEKGDNITFTVDGKSMTYEVIDHSNALAGDETYKRPIIMIPELTCGLRKLKNIPVAIVKSRDKKTTNMLLNRDAMSKLGYVINPDQCHILTEEMEKVKII